MARTSARSGSPFESAIGFSRAVRVGSTIAVSGTAPVWPDGSVDPDPAVQARRCWESAVTASTMVVVAGLLDPRWKVEIELDAVLD